MSIDVNALIEKHQFLGAYLESLRTGNDEISVYHSHGRAVGAALALFSVEAITHEEYQSLYDYFTLEFRVHLSKFGKPKAEAPAPEVIVIGDIVVETPDVLVAAQVAVNALKKGGSTGRVCWLGRYYRWMTLDQYQRRYRFKRLSSVEAS